MINFKERIELMKAIADAGFTFEQAEKIFAMAEKSDEPAKEEPKEPEEEEPKEEVKETPKVEPSVNEDAKPPKKSLADILFGDEK